MARILIVDDDRDIVDSLTMVLEANEHAVEAKFDTDALESAVERIAPDLIILDIMFPEDPHAGFAAARSLKKNQALQHIPILMLSAVNQRQNMAFGFSDSDISEDFMPVDGFVEKPVEPETLLTRIDELI